RYGVFLAFLQQNGWLDCNAAAASQITPARMEAFIADLAVRVRSTTLHGYVYGLRRAANLLAPTADFSWLAEVEKDLKVVAEPRSKFERLVLTMRLVEAGREVVDAARLANSIFAGARGLRNGLMILLLAFCPIRLKNFAALKIGQTFNEVGGHW